MLKQLSTFLAWLSGSLAGISAILYALGFVATMAEDRLLGLGFAVSVRDPEFYLERGGNVVMRTVIYAMWPALGLVVAAVLFRWLLAQSGVSERPSLETVHRFGQEAAAPSAALVLLFVTLYVLVTVLGPALGVVELLFQANSVEKLCDTDNAVTKAIRTLDRKTLNESFTKFAMFAGVAAGIGIVARSSLLEDGRRLWLATAGVGGFLMLVGLPMAYGILAAEKTAPRAWIDPPQSGTATDGVRLLSRSAGGIVVWLEDRSLVQWISSRQINALTVGRGEPITAISCPAIEPTPKGG